MNIEKRFLSEKIKELIIDEEQRTVQISWSSETPYQRNDGFEILICNEESCDLTRLNDAHPLLFNHNWDSQIGVIEKAWFENKRGYAIVRFSKNAFADEKFKDVVDKILTKVSVGYAVEEIKIIENGRSYYVVKWIPFELSLVTIPADNTVGTLKFMEILKEKENNIMKIKELENQESENEKMVDDIDEEKNKKEDEVVVEIEDETETEAETDGVDETVEEEKMVDDIDEEKKEEIDENLEKSYNKKINKDEVLNMNKNNQIKKLIDLYPNYKNASVEFLVDETKTADDFENFIKEEENKTKKQTLKGHSFYMKKDNLENYSVSNAFRSALLKENCLEKEIGQDFARQNGSYNGGIFIPFELMKKEYTGANTTNLTATTLSNYIDPLYSTLVLDKAGIQTISGLQGNVAMPKANSNATVGFIDTDTTGVTYSNQAFTQKPVTKRTASVGFELSRNAVLMPQFDVYSIALRNHLMKLALFEEKTIIDELKAKIDGSAIAIGTAPTYQQILSLKAVIKNQDAIMNKLSWLMSPQMEAKLKSTGKPATIMNAVLENGTVDGDQALVTSQYTDQTGILVGDFSQVYKFEWSGVEILTDDATLSNRGAVRYSVFHDFGWENTYDESFLLAKENVT